MTELRSTAQPGTPTSGARALAFPAATALALLAGTQLMSGSPAIVRAFVGAAAVLLLWTAALWWARRDAEEPLVLFSSVRPHHWVQALAQVGVMVYWGLYVNAVVAYAPLFVAQIVFAYGVDSLVHLSRRRRYGVGFGPVPIVFSINLFLWFRPEWFHWQFVMILVGYLAKELIRWERAGRSAHIFNPSSFPLGVSALVLLLTENSDITFGQAIATTQFYPPHMYLVIFLASLPGQILFGVVRMTLSAVVSLYGFSLAYMAVTGTYFFYDAHIPLPVFLGMHLLFTDPSTSPRTEVGRIVFGMLYAAAIAVLYVVLGSLGVPTFYDKLLPVPILNLMVRRIDAFVAAGGLAHFDTARLGTALTPLRRNIAFSSVWVGVFLAISATNGVGHDHPGQSLRFWIDACDEGEARACRYARSMTAIYCGDGSGWACNEWGLREHARGRNAEGVFRRGCELGYTPACENVGRPASATALASGPPSMRDLPIVLRGSQPPLDEDPAALRRTACQQGWTEVCTSES